MFKTAVFLLTMAVIVLISTAYGAERVYYSIHFASFKDLENANRQVNSLKEKGKMVFWKETDVPGKGTFYRVYLGRYNRREDAVAFWEKLNKAGAVSYFGVHRFTEIVEPKKIEPPPQVTVPPKPDMDKTFPLVPPKDRFVDNEDGTITDTKRNLMWIKNGWRIDFLSATTWADAQKRCKAFKLGDYSNWRLPTIEEWRSLIDTNNENPAMVEPNPFENIIGHMPYWTQTEYTYGRDYTCNKTCPLETFIVMLYSGSINHQKKSDRAFILPVRSIN